VELAVNHLLSGGAVAFAAAPSATPVAPLAELSGSTDVMIAKAGGVLRGSTSQYTFADAGRSACTCIALTAASMFLRDQNVTSSFLDRMIAEGVENYQKLVLSSGEESNQSSSVEHLSAEEILQKDKGILFPVQSSIGSGSSGAIHQGVLSHDLENPLGMKALLEGIHNDFYQTRKRNGDPGGNDEWIVVLITKTPETVLVCLPADSVSPPSYWLIDSHPRPQLGLDTSYAKLHSTMDTLLLSLQSIFPPTDLGPDVPEMMAMMYNSFDLYPLERKKLALRSE